MILTLDVEKLNPQEVIDLALTEYIAKRAKLRTRGIEPGPDIKKAFTEFRRK